ncbi:hypothetical protein K491DRAFT_646245 [Lophiostoma macrostomum CBS 122681]|uniref:BTB domain-containing protein n=1 Tax=Lophiostoma macrostomum CBS 122681 TaxID=1314788 RepID=A0A6A6TSK1_9PLEO|nr:hypothetical protein K491DRAFT_646245 [Lophiostoma macrostomum CBS 122681]
MIFSQPTITVKVGEEGQEYHVHEPLLVHYSGYFRGALGSGIFKEAADRVVTLTDVKPLAFEAFMAFIYTKSISRTKDPDWHTVFSGVFPRLGEHCKLIDEDTVTDAIDIRCIVYGLACSYVFADRFLVPELSQTLKDLTHKELSTNFTVWYETIIYAFQTLPENDPYLELLVDGHCAEWQPSCDDWEDRAVIDALPSGFLYRAMKRMFELHKDPVAPAIRPLSHYVKRASSEEAKDEEEADSGAKDQKVALLG